jgi:hypothetical protein
LYTLVNVGRSVVDVVLTREDLGGRGPVHVLRDAGVEHRRTAAPTLRDALSLARGGGDGAPGTAGPSPRGGDAPAAGYACPPAGEG